MAKGVHGVWLAERSPGVSKERHTGSGISLLWGEVCKTQVSEDVFLCSHVDKRLLLRVIQPPAIQPQPLLGPAEAAKLPLKMLGASPAKQGKGELTNGDDHQVHTHSLPGGPGPPHGSSWGPRQAENAEAAFKGVWSVALPRLGSGVSATMAVLLVQDEALLLQVEHHSGQQPRLLAFLGVGDEEVHIVAL